MTNTCQTAERLQPFGETIFSEISRLAIAHNAINLGQGFPNFDGPESVRQAAIEAISNGCNQYAPSIGIPPLREAIAARFHERTNLEVDATQNVTVTTGCTEALAAAALGLFNPGDEVILFEPFYDSYRAIVAFAGATPRFVTLHGPRFTFDPAELSSAFSQRTRAIIVNTPHNPTGRVFSHDELEVIATLCRERDVLVLADEVYEDIVFDEAEHISIATLPGMWERTLTLSSLGKSFSFTGWKVGWAVGPEALTQALRSAHQFMTFCTATPLQHAAVSALRSDAAYFAALQSDYQRKRDILTTGLEAIGFVLTPPKGTYFILADHTPFGFADDVTFCKHLIEHIGVAAIPPSAFYAHAEHGKAYVRFAFCKDDATLREALERMINLTLA
ncbi:MAG: methionine aminotransferase [Phycisphaerales bacterium]